MGKEKVMVIRQESLFEWFNTYTQTKNRIDRNSPQPTNERMANFLRKEIFLDSSVAPHEALKYKFYVEDSTTITNQLVIVEYTYNWQPYDDVCSKLVQESAILYNRLIDKK